MEIITTTSITLTNEEKDALKTLKSAYEQCESYDCFSCKDCPLYVEKHCLGRLCELVKEI